MATAATGSTRTTRSTADEKVTQQDLEADIARLREDLAQLAKQFQATGEHSYSAARNAASEGVDRLRAKGEAAAEHMRANASDIERQVSAQVREKPITSLAIAAGAGFLFALLTSR